MRSMKGQRVIKEKTMRRKPFIGEEGRGRGGKENKEKSKHKMASNLDSFSTGESLT